MNEVVQLLEASVGVGHLVRLVRQALEHAGRMGTDVRHRYQQRGSAGLEAKGGQVGLKVSHA